MEEEEKDLYVAQLKEVFDSCDFSQKKALNGDELTLLCQKLQLANQASILTKKLLGNNLNNRVGFEEFKDAFISLLTDSVNIASEAEKAIEEEYDDDVDVDDVEIADEDIFMKDRDVCPKIVFGTKRYGRRSRPASLANEDDSSESLDADISVPYPKDGALFSGSTDKIDDIDYDVTPGNCKVPKSKSYCKSKSEESFHTFADESMTHRSGSDPCLTPSTNMETENNVTALESNPEAYLKGIWHKLGVGLDGYLREDELARVCEHIGMEMSEEVVSQLFENLDCDQDGKVSFEEFLQGLFQHGNGQQVASNTSEMSCSTPLSCSPQNKSQVFNLSAPDDCQGAISSSESGIFSSLDLENTGYSDASALLSLWESLGFPHGTRILKDLGINQKLKINLLDLSTHLEEELSSACNAPLYQVALASYLHELKYVRHVYDQCREERNRLRVSISDANARASLLAQDVDEHHAKLEKSSQSKLETLEKKYQDQLREYQEQLEKERETVSLQVNNVSRELQRELCFTKEEENKLRTSIAALEKENLKLEQEILDFNQKYSELQRLYESQQKELETVTELKQRLAEVQSNQKQLYDSECQTLLEELDNYRKANKELQDQNDEISLQIETMRQQLSSGSRPHAKRHKRTGSWLGDYTKGTAPLNIPVKRRGSSSSTEENSDDDLPISGKIRRRVTGIMTPDSGEEFSRHIMRMDRTKEKELDELTLDKEMPSSYDNSFMQSFQQSSDEMFPFESPHIFINSGESRVSQTYDILNKLVSEKEELIRNLKHELERLKSHQQGQLNEVEKKNELLEMEREKLRQEKAAVEKLKEDIEKEITERVNKELSKISEMEKSQTSSSSQSNDGKFKDAVSSLKKDVLNLVQNQVEQKLHHKSVALPASDLYLQNKLESSIVKALKVADIQLEQNFLKEQMEEEVESLRQQHVLDRIQLELKYKEELQRVQRESGQMETNEPTEADILLKDLYVENARLMKEIKENEEKFRRSEQSNTKLQQKCKILSKLLADITKVAVA